MECIPAFLSIPSLFVPNNSSVTPDRPEKCLEFLFSVNLPFEDTRERVPLCFIRPINKNFEVRRVSNTLALRRNG